MTLDMVYDIVLQNVELTDPGDGTLFNIGIMWAQNRWQAGK